MAETEIRKSRPGLDNYDFESEKRNDGQDPEYSTKIRKVRGYGLGSDAIWNNGSASQKPRGIRYSKSKEPLSIPNYPAVGQEQSKIFLHGHRVSRLEKCSSETRLEGNKGQAQR